MNQDQLWEAFSSLPPAAQTLVTNFIGFLQTEYQGKPQETVSTKLKQLKNEPFVGMWRDQVQLADSSDYVRDLRTHEWGTVSG